MTKSLKLSLVFAGVLCSTIASAQGETFNSASDFSAEFLMSSALDVAQDVGDEQLNYSRISGIKKAQETLALYIPSIRLLLREVEKEADVNDTIFSAGRLVEIASWGKAERAVVNAGGADTTNTGNNIDANIGYNVAIKFAKEHHNHHLDDVTIRFVPQVSETEDREISIQGWYCETDIDWVDFTKDWVEPANESESAAVGQSVKGQRSMVMRDLPYPLSNCVVAKSNITIVSTGTQGQPTALVLGIDTDLVDLT